MRYRLIEKQSSSPACTEIQIVDDWTRYALRHLKELYKRHQYCWHSKTFQEMRWCESLNDHPYHR